MINKVLYKGKYELKSELMKIFTKDFLIDTYINRKLSKAEICEKYQISMMFITQLMKLYDIPQRTTAQRNKLSVEKSNRTCMEHYGVKRPLMHKDIYKKAQNTLCSHYGVLYNAHSENWKIKCKNTSVSKYGTEYPQQSDIVKQRMKDTCLSKYGVEYATQTDNMKEKTKRTCLIKYGTKWAGQDKVSKEKRKKTCLDRYGVECSLQSYGCREHLHAKYLFDNVKLDSAPEVAFYIWLKDNNISFEYQPNIRFEYTFKDKKHYYYPDFKINDVYYEIKGDYFFEDDRMIDPYDRSNDGLAEAKHQIMKQNHVVILTENSYQKYMDYVKEKYGPDYIINMRVKKSETDSN